MPSAESTRPRKRSIFLILLGTVIALIGLMLAVGGARLAAIGGSVSYLLGGLGLRRGEARWKDVRPVIRLRQ